MTRNQWTYAALILMAVLNIALLFMLLSRPGPIGGKHRGPKQLIIERLDLDAAQVEAYELLIQEHRAAIDRLEEELILSRSALYERMDAEGSDAIFTRVSALRDSIERIHVGHIEAIGRLCRPDQMAAFRALRG
ncbi:MAG: hypothetical protein KDB88_14585, partial [Flavobacteriales bacterium]|nr:hypothetical protein [Flavobacteriales bacterium]